jgi:YHS domain-containing protein
MARDPICGMKVDEEKAANNADIRTKRYDFAPRFVNNASIRNPSATRIKRVFVFCVHA